MDLPSYEQFDKTVPIQEYARDKAWQPGEYSQSTEVGFKDGETYFIRDTDTVQGLVLPYVLADTVSQQLGYDLEIDYDEENEKIIRPEIDGVPTDEYIPGVSGFFKKLLGEPFGPEPEELYEASTLKYFIADTDVSPNIIVNEDTAEPIDFQRAGATAKHFHISFVDDLGEVFGHLNREFSQDEFEETLSRYAQQADIQGLERDLREKFESYDTFRNGRKEDAVVRKTLENFERFR